MLNIQHIQLDNWRNYPEWMNITPMKVDAFCGPFKQLHMGKGSGNIDTLKPTHYHYWGWWSLYHVYTVNNYWYLSQNLQGNSDRHMKISLKKWPETKVCVHFSYKYWNFEEDEFGNFLLIMRLFRMTCSTLKFAWYQKRIFDLSHINSLCWLQMLHWDLLRCSDYYPNLNFCPYWPTCVKEKKISG
jgi:hypothetical protein